MSSSRKQSEVRSSMDQLSIVTARMIVSGSGVGDMSGTMIFGTDLTMTATYGSSSLGLPSGSVRLTLAGDNRYNRVLSWHVSSEISGTDIKSNALGRGNDYQVVKYGHNAASGTFDFGFMVTSGSTTDSGVDVRYGAVPEDKVTRGPIAVDFIAICRNTDRST